MNNNRFMKLIRSVLLTSLNEQGVNNARVVQGYQKKTTSAPTSPVIVIHRMDDETVGWTSRVNKTTQTFPPKRVALPTTRNEQNFITTFQINALVPRKNPEDETVNDVSADDLLRMTYIILQSQQMLDACKDEELGLLKASPILPNWVKDEHDNWENEPSFNLLIASKETLEWHVPVVEGFSEQLNCVNLEDIR